MVNQKAETVELTTDSDREFFLIHGYTGSPTDFNRLPFELHKQFQANVRVLRLAGHGTHISDLDHLSYKDLLNPVETELKADIQKGRKVILGGVSFGAQLALILASRHPVKGVFNVCLPYPLKFPFNVPGLQVLSAFKKYWKKPRTPQEEALQSDSFSYKDMHCNGLKIAKQANREIRNCLNKITCPILTIHSTHDPIGNYKGAFDLHKGIQSEARRIKIHTIGTHNVFYSMNNDVTYQEVVRFVEQNRLFGDALRPQNVAAVVPAFDEAERIAGVLAALDKASILDEIIVVDDGSKDNTEQIVKQFKRARYLKNQKNMGKAYSMDLGVKSTNAEIIFFCDADLKGLTPEIVEKIVEPVRKNKYDMSIGLRANMMQKAVRLFALNSGERAIRREVWENLPACFKRGYRIEAGLNYFTKKYGRGFGAQQFPYSQFIKETKYGVLRGTRLRWRMNYEVSLAYLRAMLDRW